MPGSEGQPAPGHGKLSGSRAPGVNRISPRRWVLGSHRRPGIQPRVPRRAPTCTTPSGTKSPYLLSLPVESAQVSRNFAVIALY